MKKTIAFFGLLLLTVLFLVSCKPDDHIIITKLAYKASLHDSTITADQREALRLLSIKDSVDLVYYLQHDGDTAKTAYLPAHNHENASPATASVFPVNNTLAAAATSGKVVDVCVCPGGTGMCPCPEEMNTNTFFTTRSETVAVKDNREPLAEEPIEGNVEAGWKAFKLSNISDRTFTLTITGDFAGIGIKTYTIPMKIEEGKLYMLE